MANTIARVSVVMISAYLCLMRYPCAYGVTTEHSLIRDLEAQERVVPVRPPEVRPRVEYSLDREENPFWVPVIKKDTKTGQAVQRKSPPPNLAVSGIIWGGNFPQAIINNSVVKEGDIIQGAEIVKIEKSGIAVLFEGSTFTLPPPAALSVKPANIPVEYEGGEYEP